MIAAGLAHDLFVPQVSLLEKFLRAFLVFAFLVVALRLGGKRELGQINVLDLAVLLLASNALQNAMIGADNSLVGGVVGATTLFAANYAFARLVFRSRRASRILEGSATILLEHGELHERALRSEAITVEELHAAALERGFASLGEVDLIVLRAQRAPGDHGSRSGGRVARAPRALSGQSSGTGSVAAIAVPPPGGLSTVSSPFTAAARSWSPSRPELPSRWAPPTPSSRTSTWSAPSSTYALILRAARTGVLDDVRQRLGDDEVGGRLERRRQPFVGDVDRHRQADARDQRLDPGAQPAVERRRDDAVREVAQLGGGALGVLERLVDQLDHRLRRRRRRWRAARA